jgi:hypothetical protein
MPADAFLSGANVHPGAFGKGAVLRVMRLQREADLLEVVSARGLTSRFARGLYGGQ